MTRLLCLTGLALVVAAPAAAADGQFYTPWKKAADGRYYCEYLYKSTVTETTYKTQYVFFDPKDPQWVYWANPGTNPDNKSGKDKYWGRCPTKAHPTLGKLIKEGKDVWSVLPDDKKKERFADLKDADFPPAKVMAPPVPGSKDGRTIACPTDPPDLPR